MSNTSRAIAYIILSILGLNLNWLILGHALYINRRPNKLQQPRLVPTFALWSLWICVTSFLLFHLLLIAPTVLIQAESMLKILDNMGSWLTKFYFYVFVLHLVLLAVYRLVYHLKSQGMANAFSSGSRHRVAVLSIWASSAVAAILYQTCVCELRFSIELIGAKCSMPLWKLVAFDGAFLLVVSIVILVCYGRVICSIRAKRKHVTVVNISSLSLSGSRPKLTSTSGSLIGRRMNRRKTHLIIELIQCSFLSILSCFLLLDAYFLVVCQSLGVGERSFAFSQLTHLGLIACCPAVYWLLDGMTRRKLKQPYAQEAISLPSVDDQFSAFQTNNSNQPLPPDDVSVASSVPDAEMVGKPRSEFELESYVMNRRKTFRKHTYNVEDALRSAPASVSTWSASTPPSPSATSKSLSEITPDSHLPVPTTLIDPPTPMSSAAHTPEIMVKRKQARANLTSAVSFESNESTTISIKYRIRRASLTRQSTKGSLRSAVDMQSIEERNTAYEVSSSREVHTLSAAGDDTVRQSLVAVDDHRPNHLLLSQRSICSNPPAPAISPTVIHVQSTEPDDQSPTTTPPNNRQSNDADDEASLVSTLRL